ncbi:MAG: hypothetical protein K8H99_07130, partial [Nitrospirae bacterium]|nr:hypothetical protein [Fimbriimonadaceae bacterium]
TGPGGRRFYGKDALGSVVATYDQNGTLEATSRYRDLLSRACFCKAILASCVLHPILGLLIVLNCIGCAGSQAPGLTSTAARHSPVGPWRVVVEDGFPPIHEATFNLLFFFDDGTVAHLHRPLLQTTLKVQQELKSVVPSDVEPTITLSVGSWSLDGEVLTVRVSDEDIRALEFVNEDRLRTDTPGFYLVRIHGGVIKWDTSLTGAAARSLHDP